MKYLLGFLCCWGWLTNGWAQTWAQTDTLTVPAGYKPAFNRQRNHDAIDALQLAIQKSDGKDDGRFAPLAGEEINDLISRTLLTRTDHLQYLLETDAGMDHRLKVNYLYGLEMVLKYLAANWNSRGDRRISPALFPAILDAYTSSIRTDRAAESIEPGLRRLPYEAGLALLAAGIFEKNPGYESSRHYLVLQNCILHPDRVLPILRETPRVPFADSLIRTLDKRKYARQLYDYAQAGDYLGTVIRSIQDDPFIRTIVQMAGSRSGQQYFPFLDQIVNGRLTIRQVDDAKDDSLLYYQLLVRTQLDYVTRAMNRDTAFEFASLTRRLEEKAKAHFVNVINGLHNEAAEVRFRCLQPLSPEELYYLAVSSDGSIYTSSFVKGVYPLMMRKINNRGDSLLMQVKFDRYRKFIKMAAGYNTLGHFLSTFPPSAVPGGEDPANTLMRAFVKNLDKAAGPEDAVDVADSYASIAESLKPLADDMLRNVGDNYRQSQSRNNTRGTAIYRILEQLFLSADSTKKVDLTRELGIPPVYEVPYTSLVNDSGRVIIQVFFYGDKDGQGIFRGFLNMFSNTNWKITGNDLWVQIQSLKGKPVLIFANRALPEEGGEDEKAQRALGEWLEKNGLKPTITIHRGHSYYANSTIEQMFGSSRIVFLGSCGGYHLIHDVLEKASDAHIIASKQIGATEVNRPFFQLLTEKLRNGQNIDWIPFWKELDRMVTAREFDDYIPPYKNLGALFIKAYNLALGDSAKR